jgi:hypothetical protein
MTMKTFDCIKQTSTTTGTGDLTLGAAVTGFGTFQGKCTSLDTFVYEAHAVDAFGARTGDAERGVGQYWLDGSTHKLRRLWKLSATNDPAAGFVDFAAGTKHVSLTVAASQASALQVGVGYNGSPAVLYVRSDGSDSNSGLANTSAQAFATLSAAFDAAAKHYTEATINIGAGTFNSGGSSHYGPCKIVIVGAGAGSTTINDLWATALQTVTVSDCTVANATGRGITAQGAGAVVELYDVDFAACSNGHLHASDGGKIIASGYTMSGGCSAGAHMSIETFGQIILDSEVTVTANITLSGGFVLCGRGPGYAGFSGASFVLGGNTVTGQRYNINACSVCDTDGGGASFLPGTVAGAVASGGQYL